MSLEAALRDWMEQRRELQLGSDENRVDDQKQQRFAVDRE
jgi:hypothetical protein